MESLWLYCNCVLWALTASTLKQKKMHGSQGMFMGGLPELQNVHSGE